MGLPPSRPAFHSRSYTSGLWVWGGLMMMGASGVGRLLLLSAGRLIGSPSFSVRRCSWPSSLCIGWSDGEASGSAPTVEPDCESVSEEDQRWLKWDGIQSIKDQSDSQQTLLTYDHQATSAQVSADPLLHMQSASCFSTRLHRWLIFSVQT